MKSAINDALEWVFKIALFVVIPLIIIGTLYIGVLALSETSRTEMLPGRLTSVHLLISSFAILAAGIFALFRLEVFRSFKPHLTISNEVTHRHVGDNYIHIAVSATLQNSSKVEIAIRKGFFLWQLIKPVPDEEIESHYDRVFVHGDADDIEWQMGDSIERSWSKNELIIEPGETYQEVGEFILPKDVESIAVYTYFYNAKFSRNSENAQGWGATTFYDIT